MSTRARAGGYIPHDLSEVPSPMRRRLLELTVMNRIGPIANIAELSMADLYGLRDGARNRDRARLGLKRRSILEPR